MDVRDASVENNVTKTGLAGIGPVRHGHCFDEGALLNYLRENIPALSKCSSLMVSQFGHGQSNPTFLLELGPHKLVLRKKPPGKILKSAHAVEREYKVLAALHGSEVPVPGVHCLCTDSSVVGTPFYVMDYVQGRVFTDPSLPGMQPEERRQLYSAMTQTMAALHRVDVKFVGLGNYGYMENYCGRQVERWAQQYNASTGGSGPAPLPAMLELSYWLRAHIPAEDSNGGASIMGLVHGDFRLDNLVFHPTEPRVVAVLDWELSTLGNQMSDVAYCCMPYHLPQGLPHLPALLTPDGGLPAGVPSEALFLSAYCQATGIQWPAASWQFYLVLSLYRAAAIFAGVYSRFLQGNASSPFAAQTGELVERLSGIALEITHQSRLIPARPPIPAATSAYDMSGPTFARPSTKEGLAKILEESPGSSGRISSERRPSRKGTHAGQSIGLGPSPRVVVLQEKLHRFMAEHVYPAESELETHATSQQRWSIPPLMEELKLKARSQGLWNLWMPADSAAMAGQLLNEADAKGRGLVGLGLSNLEYAHLCEIMGSSAWAPEIFNCSAPDTGNMEVLLRYGSVEQQRRWLVPLLEGRIRSCFAMTEPAVASSDATNIEASITRDGESYILNGRKWWTSGAMDPRCQVAIFMGKTDPQAPPHRQQSMVLVDMQSPGVQVIRPLTVFGADDAPHGHAEVDFCNVQVPIGNLLLGEGRGFEIAQGRLGPGRLHHCMRLIGAAERALAAMAVRAQQRSTFGRQLAQHGAVAQQMAESRISTEMARLMVLKAAATLDASGNKAARHVIAMAKVAAPRAAESVLDAAIQIHGAAGVCSDFPLARLWVAARTLRIADGPDEVHLGMIGRAELAKARL